MHCWEVEETETDLGELGRLNIFWAVAGQTRDEALTIAAQADGIGHLSPLEVVGSLSQNPIKAVGRAAGEACPV